MTVGDLQTKDERDLMKRYGSIGKRLARFSRGLDERSISSDRETKSISAETTFNDDIGGADELLARLWPLCEKVSRRMKEAGLAGRTVVLKLKTASFRQLTRNRQLSAPTQMAETLYQAARPILEAEATGKDRYRLIGIGLSDLSDAAQADPMDLLDPEAEKRRKIERTMDAVRSKLGEGAILKGRGLKPKK